MAVLVLLRHAKAADLDTADVPDVLRPLADAGRRNAPLAGRWLAEQVGHLDLVLASPATRVRQTWELVAAELTESPAVQEEPALYGASLRVMLALLADLPSNAGTVAMVGHNPDLSVLASALTGDRIELSTSGIAVIELQDGWTNLTAGGGRLRQSATPRPDGSD
jgi:phosphohistidine phosphatase